MVIKTIKSTLEPGATYLIEPNPLTGTGVLIVVDGDSSDNDSTDNGIIKISPAIFGPYNVTQTVSPPGTISFFNYVFTTVDFTKVNSTATFSVVDSSFSFEDLAEFHFDAPDLNFTAFGIWQDIFNAVIVNGLSETDFNSIDDLLSLIVVGNETNGLSAAINSQNSIKFVTSFTQGTSGNNIMDTFGMPTYALPNSASLDVVLPTVVTEEDSTHQVVASPPFRQVVPGQRMVFPVESSVIASFGGLSLLDVESKLTASSTGTVSRDWFVIEIDDEVPSSAPSLSSTELFLDVKYSYEEGGVGFNWGDENNYEQSPTTTVLIPVPTSGVDTLPNGCADVEVLTLVGNTWTSGIDTVLSNVPSSKSGFCDVKFESTHFSKKAVRSSPSSDSDTGGGSYNRFIDRSGDSNKLGFGGILSSGLIIHEISYDMCSKNTIQITVSSDSNTPPIVKIKKSNGEIIYAELAAEQPYTERNESSSVGIFVYEAALKRSEETFTVVVLKTEDSALSTQSTIRVTTCQDIVTLIPIPKEEEKEEEEEINKLAPRIFSLKVLADDKYVRAEDVTDEFISTNKTLAVSAIIYSPTPFGTQLRFVTLGEPAIKYQAIKMKAEPILGFNNTFVVNAVIPAELLQEPGVSYWIKVVNEESLVAKSKRYSISVKPDGIIDAVVELDSIKNLAGGSSYNPVAYVTNPSSVTVYGKVSLLADGQTVYTSPGQLFSPGESIVKLQWVTSHTKKLTSYNISAKLNLYDNSFETQQLKLYTFPAKQTVALSELDSINLITDEKGNTVAMPSMLYSSLEQQDFDYTVVSPDGTCIIGSSEQCLVSESTLGLPGDSKSVILEGQVYRIRYTGADNALERFSINSIDPIVGQWSIQYKLEDNLIPHALAMQDVTVKIKNIAKNTRLITVSSD
ncbi:MAG: hypothetical protein O6761_01670 [Thaumarchaeota archaeon]|nr:hypothetical protein [Nitrososphaerota archaeon]